MKSKRELFDVLRQRWPEHITILDVNSSGSAVGTDPTLYDIFENIIDAFERNDDLMRVAAWSFHQALDKLGRRLHRLGVVDLRPADVSFRSFNTMMISNLSDDEWENERAQYEAML